MQSVVSQLTEIIVRVISESDHEVAMLGEVLLQYVSDRDKTEYRRIERQCRDLRKAYDRMEALLHATLTKARAIEASVPSFTGGEND
jgi:hypothetical protein